MQTEPQRAGPPAGPDQTPVFDLAECRALGLEALHRAALLAGIGDADELDRRGLVFALQACRPADTRGRGDGLLQVHPDGFGFLRPREDAGSAGPDDIYVSPNQIHRLRLRPGQHVTGLVRTPHAGERYLALVRVDTVDGVPLERRGRQAPFRHLPAVLPDRRLPLAHAGGPRSLRLLDLCAPLARGHRVLVRTPATAARHRLLDDVRRGLAANHPDTTVLALLLDQRPEDAARWAATTGLEVYAATFDTPPEQQLETAALVRARAQRLVEAGRAVVLLLDSLTHLVRLANTTVPHSGKIIAPGLDATALLPAKEQFADARQIEGGGSLTVVATLHTGTGVAMDGAIADEFAGKASSCIALSAALAARGLDPALQLSATGTDWEEHLLPGDERRRLHALRTALGDDDAAALERLLAAVAATADNAGLLAQTWER